MKLVLRITYNFEEEIVPGKKFVIGHFTIENDILVELLVTFDYINYTLSAGTFRYILNNDKEDYIIGNIFPECKEDIWTIGNLKKLEIENALKDGNISQKYNLS